MGPSDAIDHRLRHVYELVDSRQYKAALKQVTTLLQKTRDKAHVMVIKAIVLERMGRAEECLEVCREVRALGVPSICDERVLYDMHQVLARLGHSQEAVETWELAAVAAPHDKDIQRGLFEAYCREELFVKQQQVAMKLYKKPGGATEQHIMWAVCSLMLQALDLDRAMAAETGTESSLRKLLTGTQGSGAAGDAGSTGGAAQSKKRAAVLQLAEALTKKHIAEHGPLKKLESVVLLVQVLRLQGKAQDALALLSGPEATLFTIPADLLQEKADILMEARDFREAAGVYKQLVQLKKADDWRTTCAFLDASLLAVLLGSESVEEAAGAREKGVLLQQHLQKLFSGDGDGAGPLEGLGPGLEKALQCLDELRGELLLAARAKEGEGDRDGGGVAGQEQANGAERASGRGLVLASLELTWRKWKLSQAGSSDKAGNPGEAAVVEGIEEYYSRFGGKACFASDVRKYVAGLSQASRAKLLVALWALAGPQGEKPWKDWALAHPDGAPPAGPREAGESVATPGPGGEEKPGTGQAESSNSGDRAASKGDNDDGSAESSKSVVEEGAAEGSENGAASEAELGRLRRILSVLRVEEIMGLPLLGSSQEDLLARAAWAVHLYLAAPRGAKPDPKEQGEVDGLLEVAASCVVEVYRRRSGQAESLALLLPALRLLLLGLSRHPFSPRHNIMMLTVYLHLGCPSLAVAHFAQLQCKHIQLDTLGHLLFPALFRLGPSALRQPLVAEALKFYNVHVNLEAGELALVAYNHGTFSKVPEFIRLKRRLRDSHHRLLLRLHQSTTAVLEAAADPEPSKLREALGAAQSGGEALELASAGALGSLSFNEDLSVRPWWAPCSDVSLLGSREQDSCAPTPRSWRWHEDEEERERREMRWRMRLRIQALGCRVLCVSLAPLLAQAKAKPQTKQKPQEGTGTQEGVSEALGTLQQLVPEWERCRQEELRMSSSEQPSDQGTEAAPLTNGANGAAASASFRSDLHRLILAAQGVLAAASASSQKGPETTSATEASTGSLNNDLQSLSSCIKVDFDRLAASLGTAPSGGKPAEGANGESPAGPSPESTGVLPLPGEVVADLGGFVSEFLPYAVLCLRVWRSCVAPQSSASSKKGKEKGKGAGVAAAKLALPPETASLVEEVFVTVKGGLKKLSESLRRIKKEGGKVSAAFQEGKDLGFVGGHLLLQEIPQGLVSQGGRASFDLLRRVVEQGEQATKSPVEKALCPRGLGAREVIAQVAAEQHGALVHSLEQIDRFSLLMDTSL